MLVGDLPKSFYQLSAIGSNSPLYSLILRAVTLTPFRALSDVRKTHSFRVMMWARMLPAMRPCFYIASDMDPFFSLNPTSPDISSISFSSICLKSIAAAPTFPTICIRQDIPISPKPYRDLFSPSGCPVLTMIAWR